MSAFIDCKPKQNAAQLMINMIGTYLSESSAFLPIVMSTLTTADWRWLSREAS
jgi:hypothetical protein